MWRSVITGKGDIAATFRPSHQATEPHSQTHTHIDSTTQPGSLQEDLFVMTASGGLLRHQLRLQAKAQSESGLTAADRYITHTLIPVIILPLESHTFHSQTVTGGNGSHRQM